jgi:hypothetical protein
MGGSQEAEILTLVWIKWNISMIKNQMVWWKKDSINNGNGMFTLYSWELGHAIDHVRTDLRGILSLPNHIITKIAAAYVPCSYQWCGVRCSCSPSKMIAQGWPKWYIVGRWTDTVAIDGILFYSYGNAVLTLVMYWRQR